MGPLAIASLSCALMLGGAFAGSRIRRLLPDGHLDGHCKDIVRLGAGLVATIVAVVLGLLINSASAAFEAQRAQVQRMLADVMLLDHLLESYGPEARQSRVLIREGVSQLVGHIWAPAEGATHPDFGAKSLSAEVYRGIQNLPAAGQVQATVRGQAADLALDIARARLLLYADSRTPLPLPVVAVLTFWFAALFLSFSLFNPVNRTAQVALAVIALSASAALFLFLELRHPFTGVVQIPSHSLAMALLPLD
jgi:hypothetical protein